MRGSAARSGAIQVESETSGGGGAPDEPNGVRRGGHHTEMRAIGAETSEARVGAESPISI